MASNLLPQKLLGSFSTVVYTLDLFLIFLTPPDPLSSVEQACLWSDILIYYEWTVLSERSEWLILQVVVLLTWVGKNLCCQLLKMVLPLS